MVLVLPCGSHLATSTGVSRTSSTCIGFPHPFLRAASCPRQGNFYYETICDPCTRRSCIRCQSATGVQTDVVVSALQSEAQKRESCNETQASTGVLIRPVEPSELEEVAWLRAEAYYEDQPHLRYVGSFKRQFKEQEAQSLKERTRCKPGSKRPECVCFVAVEEAGSSEVMGTLDAEPPGPSTAQLRRIPEGTTYVLNVVVSKKHRKRGIGRALMTAVGKLAKEQWGSDSMCTHVSAQNEAALALYKMCGFQESSQDGSVQESAGGSLLGGKGNSHSHSLLTALVPTHAFYGGIRGCGKTYKKTCPPGPLHIRVGRVVVCLGDCLLEENSAGAKSAIIYKTITNTKR